MHFGNRFGGTIYNGNKDVTVTEVSVMVTATHEKKSEDREYAVDVVLPPLTTKDFGFDIVLGNQGTEYSWRIVGAKGY